MPPKNPRKQPPMPGKRAPPTTGSSPSGAQPKLTNKLKRSLADALGPEDGLGSDLEREGGRKRVAVDSIPDKAVPDSLPPTVSSPTPLSSSSDWIVEGHYNFVKVESKGNIDTHGLTFALKYLKAGNDSQLYASFKFDSVQGIMRLCPRTALRKKHNKVLPLAEFEKACSLGEDEKPGPNIKRWLTRWRGQDGGMRLGKLVGGEADTSFSFQFKRDSQSDCDEFHGVKIKFVFAYDGNLFGFNGIKVGNLKLTEQDTQPDDVKLSWAALYNPEWKNKNKFFDFYQKYGLVVDVLDSDTGSEQPTLPTTMGTAKLGPNEDLPESHKAPDAGQISSMNKEKDVPAQNEDSEDVDALEALRESERAAGPIIIPGAFYSGSELRDMQRAEYQATKAAELKQRKATQNKQLAKPGPEDWFDGIKHRKVIQAPPEWSWDVTGKYTIDPQALRGLRLEKDAPMTMEIRMSNNPQHSKIGRQLWAIFDLGKKYQGIIRFIPQPSQGGGNYDTLKQFEAQCVLDKNCWPGKAPQGQEKWRMRWKGISGGKDEYAEDNQTSCGFEMKDENIVFKAVFVPGEFGVMNLLKAEKIGDLPPEKRNGQTVVSIWENHGPPKATRAGRA